MAIISQTRQDAPKQFLGAAENQADAVRRMLVAVIDDVRVALIKLAENSRYSGSQIRGQGSSDKGRSRSLGSLRAMKKPQSYF